MPVESSKPQPLNVEVGKEEADAIFRRRDLSNEGRRRWIDQLLADEPVSEFEAWCEEYFREAFWLTSNDEPYRYSTRSEA